MNPRIGPAGSVDRNPTPIQLLQDRFELTLNRTPGFLALPSHETASIEVEDREKGSAHSQNLVVNRGRFKDGKFL